MTRSNTAAMLIAVLFSMGLPTDSFASLVDLNDFFADPTVMISVDGFSALLEEPPPGGLSLVILSNDPGLGDPPILSGGPSKTLSFDFDFVLAAGESDAFDAFVIDLTTGVSAGPGFEFFADTSSAGTVTFDLSTLPGTIGLQFQLSSLPGDSGSGSTLLVSNVQQQTTVPEPGTLLLLCGGLGTSLLARRRSTRREA